ncbi:MAG: hypothetical protein ACRYGJ_21460 [Janthinobacterium lividum]
MAEEADKSSSGEIIPFPGHFRLPTDATARLERAILALDQANVELRDSIAGWRRATEALTISLGEVTRNLQVFNANMTSVPSNSQGSSKHDQGGS